MKILRTSKQTACRKRQLLLLLVMIVHLVPVQAQLVYLQENRLHYQLYANQADDANPFNRIPDFSYAGYQQGGVALPSVPVRKTLEPADGDAREAIQEALDEVAAMTPDENGIRGAVLLTAGVYQVSGTLTIAASGVVLRGEGTSRNQTVLIATQKAKHDFIVIRGQETTQNGTVRRITSSFVPTGSQTIEVEEGHSFQQGDEIAIRKTPNDAWIEALDMVQYGWTASTYRMLNYRKIAAVNGTVLTLDLPVYDPYYEQFGGADVYTSERTGYVENSGVEDLRLESVFDNDSDEAHAWNAVTISMAANCWVKNVVAKYFAYACVNLSNSARFNTVEDCAMIDPKAPTTGGYKYSFNVEGTTYGNLFQRCYTWGGRHDFVSGSRVPGPNVFLDGVSLNTRSDSGPHHRWATGQLYDNLYVGDLIVQNRKALGSGHGWAGAQVLFWNSTATKGIKVESPPYARNWGIGSTGATRTGDGYWESYGTAVVPRSLYLQQLEDRLGNQAVMNITTPEQLDLTLRALLQTKAAQIQAEPPVYAGAGPTGNGGWDITDNGGILTAQYANTSKPAENFPSLIDNNYQTKYFVSNVSSLWIMYQSAEPATVYSYALTSGNDRPGRDPKDWILYGSNDLLEWTLLDERQNESFPERGLTQEYQVGSPGEFLYFRLEVSENHGETAFQLAEWELFGREETVEGTYCVADAYIRGGTYADTNFGSEGQLAIKKDNTPANAREAYLKFIVPGITSVVPGARTAATTLKLRLHLNGTNATGPGVTQWEIWKVAHNNWKESEIMWNNRPEKIRLLASIPNDPAIGFYEWDISDVLSELRTDVFSIALVSTTTGGTTNASFASREHGNLANRPALSVETTGLPVTLSGFRVTSDKEAVQPAALLEWSTTSELNCDYFEILRSSDALSWQAVARVESQLSSGNTGFYLFRDTAPLPGRSYYRLKIVDIDGSFSLSPMQDFKSDAGIRTGIYPNPATAFVTLPYRIELIKKVTILDTYGRLIYQNEALGSEKVPLSGMAPGSYLLRVEQNEGPDALHRLLIAAP